MFIQRAIIALTLGPLALYLVYLGGLFYFIPVAAILLLASAEYVQLTRKIGWNTSYYMLLPAVAVNLVVGQWTDWNLTGPAMLVTLLLVVAYALWRYERHDDAGAPGIWMAMSVGVILFGWIGSHFFRLRGLPDMAWQWTILALVSTWLADSAAYVVGKFMAGKIIGRHRLSPRLSPNKTVEGYVGGIVLGTAFSMLGAYLLQLPLTAALVISLAISIFSVLGDLSISMLKRVAGVKDSSRIFGEHGGALDRVDSLTWSMALAYYLIIFLAI